MSTYKNVVVSILLLASIAFTGCSAPKEEIKEEVLEATTTVGLLYVDMLKLGSLSTEEVSSLLVGYDYVLDTDVEQWEKNNSDTDKTSYYRKPDKTGSYYSKVFTVNTSDIQTWIGTEVEGLNTLLNTQGVRQSESGVTWSYSWAAYPDETKLLVFSTGQTGQYAAVFATMRTGLTYIETEEEVVE